MQVTINDGVALLVVAAYRLGAKDALAPYPDDLINQCIDFIEAETDEEAQVIADELKIPPEKT